MTEDEVKTKWCPFARHTSGDVEDPASSNRWGEIINPESCRCIGSACMAWRWMRTHIKDPSGGPDLVPSTDTHGFCGLAGSWFADLRP